MLFMMMFCCACSDSKETAGKNRFNLPVGNSSTDADTVISNTSILPEIDEEPEIIEDISDDQEVIEENKTLSESWKSFQITKRGLKHA